MGDGSTTEQSGLPRRVVLGAAWSLPVVALAASAPAAAASMPQLDVVLELNRYLEDGAIVQFTARNFTSDTIVMSVVAPRTAANGVTVGSITPAGWALTDSGPDMVFTASVGPNSSWRQFVVFYTAPAGAVSSVRYVATAPGYASTAKVLPLAFP